MIFQSLDKNTTAHIMMTFAGKVESSVTDFVRPTLSSILSDVGGSLGLWLGLGALQALEICAQNVLLLVKRLRWDAKQSSSDLA